MSFISITSDFGITEGNAARIKAKILSHNADTPIIEISYTINPFDLEETAYILKNSVESFPNNSIHLIFVDALDHPVQKPICAQINGQFYISNNNGITSLLHPDIETIEVREIDSPLSKREDVFCETAVRLSKNPSDFRNIGKTVNPKILNTMKPAITKNEITGHIIFVDNYGNAISNVEKTVFEKIRDNRKFEIFASNYRFETILTTYTEIVKDFKNENRVIGEKMALFNSAGFLEFAMYKSNRNSVGGASQLLGLRKGQKVIIRFH